MKNVLPNIFFQVFLEQWIGKIALCKNISLSCPPFLSIVYKSPFIHFIASLGGSKNWIHHSQASKWLHNIWKVFEFLGVKGFSFVFLPKPNYLQHWLCANIHFSCYRYLYLFVILNVKCSWKLTIQFGCGGMEVVSAG